MKKNTVFIDTVKKKYFERLPGFKEKNTQAFTTIILTLLALSLFGYFAINPTVSTIAELKKQLVDTTLLEQRLTQKISNLSTLQQKFFLIQNDIPIIESAIPKSPTVPTLVSQIQGVAKNSGISLTRLQTFEVELKNNKKQVITHKHASYNFSLDAKGSYETIVTFLDNLTTFNRIVTIDSISLSADSKNNQQITVNIRGKAYFLL